MSDCVLDSFVFYRSFRDAIREMDEQEQLETLLAICDYALYGVEPNLSGALPRAVFTVARPSIDANKAKRENGLKGGRPPQKAKQETYGFEAKNHRFDNTKSTVTVSETETVSVSGKVASGKMPQPRFVPPSIDEIRAYCIERQNAVDAERFLIFTPLMVGSKGEESRSSIGKRRSERGSAKIMRDKLNHRPDSTTRLRTHGGDAWTRF